MIFHGLTCATQRFAAVVFNGRHRLDVIAKTGISVLSPSTPYGQPAAAGQVPSRPASLSLGAHPSTMPFSTPTVAVSVGVPPNLASAGTDRA